MRPLRAQVRTRTRLWVAVALVLHVSQPAFGGTDHPTAAEDFQAPRGRSILTLLLLSGALAGIALGPDTSELSPRWTARNGFDDGIRNGLRAESASGRRAAQIVSDVLLGSLGAGLLADWIWLDERGEYPLRNSLTTDSSWILATLIGTQSVKLAAARPRPFVEECATDPDYVTSCNSPGRFNASFFSGHASLSATFAGLLCARHLARENRDRKDIAICGGAVTASLATGMLRITADEHYATDVLVGWGVGAAFGYVLPRIVDYRGPGGPFSRLQFAPVAGRRQWGVVVRAAW